MSVDETVVDYHAIGAGALIGKSVASHGFCRVRGAFAEGEVAVLRAGLAALMAQPPREAGLVWHSPAAGGGSVVQRISRTNLFAPTIWEGMVGGAQLGQIGSWVFGGDPGDIAIATGLEGSDGVVAVIKDPRNASEHAALRWHCDDSFTRHLDINPFVNCGIYLDRSDATSGALIMVARGQPFPSSAKETVDAIPHQQLVEADVGDVVVHAADVWHRSGCSNPDADTRRVLYANVFRRRR